MTLSQIDERTKPTHRNLFFWLGLLIILILSLGLQFLLLGAFPMLPDEGIHMMWIRLIKAGYIPYSQVYITYPPLYPLFLMASWALSSSLEGLYWSTFFVNLISVIVIALIARRTDEPVTGLVAALFFALTPEFLRDGNAVMGEMPSIVLSILAVYLALCYRDSGRRLLLILSALFMALSLLMKVLSPFAVILIAFIIISRYLPKGNIIDLKLWKRLDWKRFSKDFAIWCLILLLPIVLSTLFIDIQAFLGQVIGQRLSARAVYSAENIYVSSRLSYLQGFIAENLFLLPMAVIGLWLSFSRKLKDRETLAIWFVLALLMLLVHEPVRAKHFAILLPVLTIWAATAISKAGKGIRDFKSGTVAYKIVVLLTCLLLLPYLVNITMTINKWLAEKQPLIGYSDKDKYALKYIKKITMPDDCIIIDDQRIAYGSGLLIPPELAEITYNRIKSGYLTTDQMIEITKNYKCNIVVSMSTRFDELLPDYVKWLRTQYYVEYTQNRDTYFSFIKDAKFDAEQQMEVNFQKGIQFLGYTFNTTDDQAGSSVPLILFWRTQDPIKENYSVFVQLRDANGQTVLTADHQPIGGVAPTSRWDPGNIIKDVVWLKLPADLPKQEYGLYIGLYQPDNMERLPIINDQSGENAILLTRVRTK